LDYIFVPTSLTLANGGSLVTDITVGEANDAFVAATGILAARAITSGFVIDPGGSDLNSNTVTNGGFYTSNASPLPTGTSPIYPSNLAYVFILRMRDTTGAQNTLSYLYFYVNIASITQS